jgi:hypothetical protein
MATNTAATTNPELAPKLVEDMMAGLRRLALKTPNEDASATLKSLKEESQST